MSGPSPLPFLTGEIEGTGGVIKKSPSDFRVDEIASYEPAGEGDHVFVAIRKTGISTFEAIRRIAAALNVKDRDIGSAGLKDAQAVTTQMLSLPPPVTPPQAQAIEVDGVEILTATRHPHKLKTGHLRGNRFAIVIRELDTGSDSAAERARAVLNVLSSVPGTPNWFGVQRFGARGDNAERGRELLVGELRGKKPKPRILRLFLSAIQSALFNAYLTKRIEQRAYRQVIEGDVLKKTDSGGVFNSTERDNDHQRMLAGEVVATGPMFGPKMKAPLPDTPAAELEATILDAFGLTEVAFTKYAKLTPGTRRPIAVALGDTDVNPIEDRAIEVRFTLPSGSYATSVLREITKAHPS